MNQTELESLLQANDIFGADCISAPERFVEILAVPPAELGGAVVDVIKRSEPLENSFNLAELAHVASRVRWTGDAIRNAESDLVGLMMQIAGYDEVATGPELRRQTGSYRPAPPGD